MADEWVQYVTNFDLLMEEALKICVRNSLQYMFEALHGDGTTPPSPMLKLFANLRSNRVSVSCLPFYSFSSLLSHVHVFCDGVVLLPLTFILLAFPHLFSPGAPTVSSFQSLYNELIDFVDKF